MFGNGIVIRDYNDVDEDAPYYIGLQKKTGTLALTSDLPTNYVTTDTEQTITKTKTIDTLDNIALSLKGAAYDLKLINSGAITKAYYVTCNNMGVGDNHSYIRLHEMNGGGDYHWDHVGFWPGVSGEDLGLSTALWQNLYLSNNLSDGTNSITVANIANKNNYTYQTTAPTAAISDGGIHIVYLSAEPSTKYAGYIYMIAEQ